MSRTCEANYYDILGVPQDASLEEIKSKYKALVLKFHPDRESSVLAREAIVLINNAYETLSDPENRAEYDFILLVQSMPSNESSQAPRQIPVNFNRIIKIITIALAIGCLSGCLAGIWQADDKAILDQFVGTNRHQFLGILNEVLVALPVCIPGFGLAWGVIAGFATGFIGKAVFMASSDLPAKASAQVLPYMALAIVLKLAGYYIGMYRSWALVILIKRRYFTKLDTIFTKGDIIVVVILSAAAGYVEHLMLVAGR